MKNKAAVALGSIKTEKKAKSSRENGKLGGRPTLPPECKEHKYLEDGCEACETWFNVRILDKKDFVFDPKDYIRKPNPKN